MRTPISQLFTLRVLDHNQHTRLSMEVEGDLLLTPYTWGTSIEFIGSTTPLLLSLEAHVALGGQIVLCYDTYEVWLTDVTFTNLLQHGLVHIKAHKVDPKVLTMQKLPWWKVVFQKSYWSGDHK